AEGSLAALLPEWRDGRIKQALIARLLASRRQHARLFSEGSYEPLTASGPRDEHVVAFLRRLDDQALLVVAPRLMAKAVRDASGLGVPASFWEDTRLDLPEALRGRCAKDLFVGRTVSGDIQDLAALLSALPLVAVELR